MAIEPKIAGVIIPRRVFTQPGSFSTELVWTKRSLRSAMPPIATELTRQSDRPAPDALGMSASLRSLRTFAPQRIDAVCHKRHNAVQQTATTRSPRRRARAAYRGD